MRTRGFARSFEFFMEELRAKVRKAGGGWTKLKAGLDACVEPVRSEVGAFLILLVALVCGAECYNYAFYDGIGKASLITLVQMPFFVAVSYVFAVLSYFVRSWGRWARVLPNVLLAFYVVLTIAECYLCLFMESGITPSMLTFLLQTNPGETMGFFQAFVVNKGFFMFVVAVMMASAFVWVVVFLTSDYLRSSRIFGYCVFGMFLLSVALLMLVPYPSTAVSRTVGSVFKFGKAAEAQRHISQDTGIIGIDIESPVVLVVIGEAFSKHHSSLYGYEKQTNPMLQAYVDAGNLFLFRDVMSPYNKTHLMIRTLLSMHSVDSQNPWEDYPIWCQIFKEAGYHVSFVSNQGMEVPRQCFDYCNSRSQGYDEELLKELVIIDSLADGRNNLAVLQLKGQHIYATNNFPHEGFTYFYPADYDSSPVDLDARQVQELADYDNATRYNDYVVAHMMDYFSDRESIVVYLSDHGEEVYDYRPFLGRTHKEVPTQLEIRYQYEIPFMIYMSDIYKSRHPDVVRRVEDATGRRFMSDDLPHLLLGVSGIETVWYDSRRDLLSPDFNVDRKRVFGY